MNTNKIAKKLKKYRKAKNLSAQQVSLYLKENGYSIEPRSIYSYENGSRIPKADVFLHLCRLYECTDILYEFGYGEKFEADFSKEQELINQYRKLDDREKGILEGFLNIMLNVRNKQEEEDEEW